jgi:SAM-dependent methyltransferase
MTSNPPLKQDLSNGWEEVADEFLAWRMQSTIGADVVQTWSQLLPSMGRVLDLGCGTGVPISQTLIESGFHVYGVDASPTMVAEFALRFPQAKVVCEPVEASSYFRQSFDGIVAIGLMFLLPADMQRRLIFDAASALNSGGRFLFTSPSHVCQWADLMTGHESRSLGEEEYIRLLSEAGLVMVGHYTDEGGNHYFHAQKPYYAPPL